MVAVAWSSFCASAGAAAAAAAAAAAGCRSTTAAFGVCASLPVAGHGLHVRFGPPPPPPPPLPLLEHGGH